MTVQLTLDQAFTRRDHAMASVEANAERHAPAFADRAAAFVLDYLKRHGKASGEDITLACIAAGIQPHDDRAFGPVYMRLSRSRKIRKAGFCVRKRGHGSAGGHVWELVAEAVDSGRVDG